jgi:hypothetical protein
MRLNCIRTVRFTQSTLVSICHASTHIHQTHHRFQIFPNQVAPPTCFPLSSKRGFQVDLHTSQSPVIACGCTRLQDLFCTEGGARVDTSIVLYAVKRQAVSGEAAPKGDTVSREKTYLFDQAWQPSVPQTTRGMAALLSCLYRLAHLIPLKGVAAEVRVLSTLHQITCFPPAVRARKYLPLSCLTVASHLSLYQWGSYSSTEMCDQRSALPFLKQYTMLSRTSYQAAPGVLLLSSQVLTGSSKQWVFYCSL